MKKANTGIYNLLLGGIEFLVGLLLFLNPACFTEDVVAVAGAGMIIFGISSIIGYFCKKTEKAIQKHGLSKGMLLISGGIFFLLRSAWIMNSLSSATIFYGVFILVAGITKLQSAVDMLRIKQKYVSLALVNAVLTMIVADIVLLIPFSTEKGHWNFIAGALLVEAALDLLLFLFIMTKDKEETESMQLSPMEKR